ncbi:AAA domain-containing protein [Marinitoga sp. 38H-ov]|uniref:AAA domain-containing protein n=1 Tax=Marinitoga sp. 38H-ov TaxID=1755814 RepID=UPI0013ED616D|nr:AAA domain-containing protein [Marinitoga sp. 38H-ov]KAF2956247.1 hypothetical protein AS160_00175 [Marinitoga sp. 38H-ov]
MSNFSFVLEKYKNRLIDISSKNRTFCMTKLYKKRSFDLAIFEEYFEGVTKEILEHIISSQQEKVCILDYNAFIKENREKLENDDDEIYIKKEKLDSFSHSLKTLKREINTIEKETGRYELYIGYPYVEGKLKDETYVKSPLFLFPISLINIDKNWYIQRLKDENVIVNKVFLIAYQKHNEVKINEKEYEGDYTPESIIKYFKDLGIELEYENNTIEKFIEGKNDIKIPKLVIKNYLILGNYKLSSSIYNDYLYLENQNINNKLLKYLLLGEKDNNNNNNNDLKKEYIEEKDFYYISTLDFSQEKAIKMSDEKDGLVIYGPPGTGKSQTISNLITHNLAKGKKVLVVSEKRAALDVILNRLSPIKNKIMLIHDAQKDKKEIYKKIKDEFESIKDGDKDILNNIIKYSEKINKNLKELEEFGSIMYQERDFGLSLANMYAKTNQDLSEDEKKLFSKFREHFQDYKYIEIKEACNNIKDKIERYIKYRNIQEEYKNQIEDTKKDLDLFLIDETLNKISNFLDYFPGKLSFNSNYKEDIKIALIENQNLENFAKILNKKENKKLYKKFEKFSKFNWYNPLHFLFFSIRKNKREEIKKIIEEKEKNIFNNIKDDFELAKDIISKSMFLKEVIDFENFKIKLINEYDLKDYLEKLKIFLTNYEEYYKLNVEFSNLIKIEKEILEFIYLQKGFNENFVFERIEKFFILKKITEIEKKEKNKILKYEMYDEYVKNVIESMETKKTDVVKYINSLWNSNFLKALRSDYRLSKNFERQIHKKSKLLPIRKLIETFDNLIFNLYPCFLATPESVSEILPLKEGLFDIIIFDEASQIFVEKAIPAIFRAKKVVVSGDDKQLKPTSIFMSREEIDEEFDMEISTAIEEESLLDVAKINFDSTHLLFHYRSKYKELIDFSNHAFYDGKLYISPNISNEKAIERIKVNGIWKNRQNLEEAKEVVALVKKILLERKENETIGIVTFNINQADLIYDLLDNEARNDKIFENLYNIELNRTENGEDKSLFVKNIENVQGDERDIIIFSTAYSKDEKGKFRFYFGSLSNEGGENRLNVAISRAKKKIYIVTSFEPEELNVDNFKNRGPKFLKDYLKYVRAISQDNKKEAERILYSLSNIEGSQNIIFESPFEEEVYEHLTNSFIIKDNKLEIHTQINSSGYRIDIGIYDPVQSKYILGIECDGARYHSSKSARERDIHRQRFLESKGWKIIRIWSRNWWLNKEKEIKNIEYEIEKELNIADINVKIFEALS